MPRRIASHHPPTPPMPLAPPTSADGGHTAGPFVAQDAGSAGLGAQVQHVLEAWAVSAEHTEQTRTRMSETVTRFVLHATARGARDLSAVTAGDARAFITAQTRHGREPELATRHARRTALRTLYRTARRLGLAGGDPTLDIDLPPRGCLAARPLTDDEVTLCRASTRAIRGPGASLRATAWALGEATAVSSEITRVRIRDLDDPLSPRLVRLPGTRRHDARTASLTAWGSVILGERAKILLDLHDEDTLLAYGGHAPPGGAKAQASVCNALRHVLHTAGLLRESDVRPASLRHWAGRSAYETGTPLEDVARALGLRSLDATAEDIALDWRHRQAGPLPTPAPPAPRPSEARQRSTEAPLSSRPAGRAAPVRHLSLASPVTLVNVQEDSQ